MQNERRKEIMPDYNLPVIHPELITLIFYPEMH